MPRGRPRGSGAARAKPTWLPKSTQTSPQQDELDIANKLETMSIHEVDSTGSPHFHELPKANARPKRETKLSAFSWDGVEVDFTAYVTDPKARRKSKPPAGDSPEYFPIYTDPAATTFEDADATF